MNNQDIISELDFITKEEKKYCSPHKDTLNNIKNLRFKLKSKQKENCENFDDGLTRVAPKG